MIGISLKLKGKLLPFIDLNLLFIILGSMYSERRMYFKKQIMKNLSQQENAIKEGTSTENNITVIDNPYSERVPLMTVPINKEDTNAIEKEPQVTS